MAVAKTHPPGSDAFWPTGTRVIHLLNSQGRVTGSAALTVLSNPRSPDRYGVPMDRDDLGRLLAQQGDAFAARRGAVMAGAAFRVWARATPAVELAAIYARRLRLVELRSRPAVPFPTLPRPNRDEVIPASVSTSLGEQQDPARTPPRQSNRSDAPSSRLRLEQRDVSSSAGRGVGESGR